MARRWPYLPNRPPPANLEAGDAAAYLAQLRQQQRGPGPDHRHQEGHQQAVSRALGHYPPSEECLHPAKPYITRKSISGFAQAHAVFALNLCSTGGRTPPVPISLPRHPDERAGPRALVQHPLSALQLPRHPHAELPTACDADLRSRPSRAPSILQP